MTTETTGLAVIEDETALTVLTTGFDDLINSVREKVENDVADISKKKGRDEIVSNAFKVTKSKTYIEGRINDLIAQKREEIKPTLEIIETLKGNKKKSNETLSQLARDTRSVITQWEAEQRAIEAARIAREADEELAIEIAADEELAGFMDADHDREVKAEAARIEAKRVSDEEEATRKAAEAATAEAERLAKEAIAKIESDKQKAIQKAADAEALAKQAVIDKEASEERERVRSENAETARIAAKEQADIDAAIAAEDARLAEKKRQDDEAAQVESDRLAREKDKDHKSEIMREAKESLMEFAGFDEETAKAAIVAIYKREVKNVSIQF